MSLIDKLAVKFKYNKSIESVSRRRTQMVRDSHLLSTGTFTILILAISFFTIPFFMGSDVFAASSSITVSIDDSTIDLNVAPTGQGAFSKSNATTIGVSTTNYTGYTLSIAAQEGDNPTALINGSSSLSSIESALTESQFKALDSTAYNNQWGYLPSKYNSENNNSFLPSPTTEGDILDVTSSANASGVVNEYEITLGARVDTTASLGSYSNTFVIYATSNAIPYTIVFDDNVVGSMPTDIASETTGTTVTLPSNVPTRDGYTFLGWCTVIPTTTNGVDSCTGGTSYNASGTITLDQTGGSNNYHLYAMWQRDTYMQNWNGCGVMSVGDTVTLPDIRDDEQYLIGKLADGKCWMLDNLRLGGTSAIKLTSEDTNINSDFTLPAGISLPNVFDSYATAQIDVDYKNETTTSYGVGSGKVGVYYNFCAVSAGTYCYTQGAGTGNANYDICPRGWRLPTGGNGGEFQTLYSYYNNSTATNVNSFQYNLSTPLSGYIFGTGRSEVGTKGRYWASTYSTGSDIWGVRVQTTVVAMVDYFRNRGLPVRCLLK